MAAVATAAAPATGHASGHYHFSVKGFGRGTGAPIMAKAAYRSGECLYDERNGEFHDYRGRAESVVDTFVMTRADAPAWTQHAAREVRQRAWNEAERADANPKARIATEIEVGLPHELTDVQRKELLSEFVRRIVDKHGVFADVAIHTAHDERNDHAHVLLSHRELGPEGFGEIANRRTITRKHRGQVKEMTTAGIAATPADIRKLREQWAQDVNRAYEKAGLDIRVDHRSFADRGMKELPTIHLGPKATGMERRGENSDRGDVNRIIQFGNAELQQLEVEKQRQDAEIIDLQAKLAQRAAQEAAKGRADDIRPLTPGQEDTRTGGPENDRQPHFKNGFHGQFGFEAPGEHGRPRQPESEDMDDDIIVKQRQQRQEIEDRQAARYNDMVAERNRADRFIQDWQRDHENGERNRRHYQEAQWRREAESDITDVRARAILAAGESRDFVQAVRREGAMITKEHADLQREIALEKDPDKKHLLELKRDIQQADYMALANERVAAMSNLGGEQYKEAMRQQEIWANNATELRKERLELQERMADQEMDKTGHAVEQTNAANRQQAEFRADSPGSQPDAQAAQTQETAEGWRPVGRDEVLQPGAHVRMNLQTGQTEIRAEPHGNDPQLPEVENTDARQLESSTADHAEITDPKAAKKAALARHREETEQSIARENTDARQRESATADHAEITDSKAAKKAALAQFRTEIEYSIAQAQGRGHGNSR